MTDIDLAPIEERVAPVMRIAHALILALAGCAIDTVPLEIGDAPPPSLAPDPARPRWLQETVAICAEPDLEAVTAAAARAWYVGPKLIMGCPGLITVTYEGWSDDGLAGAAVPFGDDDGAILWVDVYVYEAPYNDLQATLVHELGHAIGLRHSSDPESAMYDYSVWGFPETRVISEDDVRQAEELYGRHSD